MSSQLLMQTYEIIEKSLKKHFTPENLSGLLDMYVKFPQMPYYNLLLILEQYPNASVICGKQAWEQYGGTITGEKPIILLIPEFYLSEEIDEDNSSLLGKTGQLSLKASPCYDISQVDIQDDKKQTFIDKPVLPNVIDALRRHNQRVLDDDPANPKIKHTLISSVYDYDGNVLLLNPRLTPEEKQKQALNAFVTRYINKTYRDAANYHDEIAKYLAELQDYAAEILSRYYGISKVFEPTASGIFEETSVVQGSFLRELWETVFTIIQSLERRTILGFNETMFCNIFLISTSREEVQMEINEILDKTYSQQLLQDVLSFRDLFTSNRVISDESICELYQMKTEKKLFTFPSMVYTCSENTL